MQKDDVSDPTDRDFRFGLLDKLHSTELMANGRTGKLHSGLGLRVEDEPNGAYKGECEECARHLADLLAQGAHSQEP